MTVPPEHPNTPQPPTAPPPVSLPLTDEAAAWIPNPRAHSASVHTADWLDHWGVRTPRSERYASLAAWVYPTADLTNLELAADVSAFFRVFDDFTDDLGADLQQVHLVSLELTGLLYERPPSTVVGRIFHDLWSRQQDGMSADWQHRAVRHWEWYFATQVPYRTLLDPRASWTAKEYLELRQGNGAVPICLDLAERALGVVPAHVYHCTPLRLMRRVASDVIVHCNDVYSSVRDRAADDPRNLVDFTRRQAGCSWQEAVGQVETEMTRLDALLRKHAGRLESECELLGFNAGDRERASVAARIVHDWNDGYQAWAAANELLMDDDPPRVAVTNHLTRSW